MISEKFALELKNIADNLEKERIKIYKEKVVPWETDDKEYADNWLSEIVISLNNVSEFVEYMDFERDEIDEKIHMS